MVERRGRAAMPDQFTGWKPVSSPGHHIGWSGLMSTIERERAAARATRVVAANIGVWARIARMWRERQLLVFMVSRDLKVKYKNSALGMIWSLLNPALVVTVYTLVFGVALKNGIPKFAIFLMAGLIFWNFFSSSVSGGCSAVVGNGHLVKKVSFSREILALAAMGTSAMLWFFQVVIFAGALVLFHLVPATPYVYLLPIALLALVTFSAALAIFFSAVNVYFRDVQHLLEVALFAWFFGNPIVYPWSTVAPKLANHHLTWLYLLNPIAPIVMYMQRTFYGNPLSVPATTPNSRVPPPAVHTHFVAQFGPMWYVEVFGVIIAVSFILFLLALKLFGRLEGNFAEEL